MDKAIVDFIQLDAENWQVKKGSLLNFGLCNVKKDVF